MQVDWLRHSGWFAPEMAREPLNIIGVGATGSFIALTAARMGFHRFKIWDADVVESHNLPNQVYDVEHIGRLKVDALTHVLKRFNPKVEVESHPYFFTRAHEGLLDGPLILTTDTMKSRKEIAEAFTMNPMVKGVFETRLGFDYGELNYVDNNDPAKCREWVQGLKDDSEIPDGPCNMRICTTLVQIVASNTVHMICSMFVAEQKQEPWQHRSKTMFNLTPTLAVYQF